jgi:4-aminobutyrate aminotransferase-like enzyme
MAEIKPILEMNRFNANTAGVFSTDLAIRIAQRQQTFGASSVLFYEQPIELTHGEGVFVFDANGRSYLDVYNNVASVGHGHPRVVEAIAHQATKLNVNTRYLNRVVEAYSERLLATFPAPLSNVVLTCTGSEANDLALRIATSVTEKQGFIVTTGAYHGNTSAVTEISPSSLRTRRVGPHVRLVPAPDRRSAAGGDIATRFANQIAAAIAELKRSEFGFAGLVVDTIFASDGIYAEPAGFLQLAAQVVKDAGGLFIADEVQAGFGRTGGGLWGFARHGIVPDVVTLGKPMGNGFPMGGVVTRPEYLAAFCNEVGYFNTFGGNPVAAAAGIAVLDIIAEECLIENVASVGSYLKDNLLALKSDYPGIGDIRGAGLYIGLDLNQPGTDEPDAVSATRLVNAMKQHGVLIGTAGRYGHTLKIRPPLCFSIENVDCFLRMIRVSLAEISKAHSG